MNSVVSDIEVSYPIELQNSMVNSVMCGMEDIESDLVVRTVVNSVVCDVKVRLSEWFFGNSVNNVMCDMEVLILYSI